MDGSILSGGRCYHMQYILSFIGVWSKLHIFLTLFYGVCARRLNYSLRYSCARCRSVLFIDINPWTIFLKVYLLMVLFDEVLRCTSCFLQLISIMFISFASVYIFRSTIFCKSNFVGGVFLVAVIFAFDLNCWRDLLRLVFAIFALFSSL